MHRRWVLRSTLALLLTIVAGWFSNPAGVFADDQQALRVKAANVASLRNLVGQSVTVYGRIGSTGISTRSGHHFLNFADSELTAVCFAPDVEKFTSGKPADAYRNRDVEITGKLELYRSKLQIKLGDPSQIRTVAPVRGPPGDVPVRTSVELKKTGTDSWLSPAGLKYMGRDAEGRTRVEHILRHASDIPDRDGPHGVFDGGPEAVFGVIDEAWLLAKKKGIRPETERGRSLYLVPMGRRVGYLGAAPALSENIRRFPGSLSSLKPKART